MKEKTEFNTRYMLGGLSSPAVHSLHIFHFFFCGNNHSLNRKTAMLCAPDMQSVRFDNDGVGLT